MENNINTHQHTVHKNIARDTWLISDTHFLHKNILKFIDSNTGLRVRPDFDTVEEMNEHMIERWNSVIKQHHRVYHLGDVFFGDKEEFQKLFTRLNGSKRLIVGNHDNIKYLAKGNFFSKIQMWRMFPELGLMFSHVPLHPSSLRRGAPDSDVAPLFGIHGHIHQNKSPRGPYRNVSVEAINYTPVHLDTLIAEAKQYAENQWELDRPFLQP